MMLSPNTIACRMETVMYRDIVNEFAKWYDDKYRKPMLLTGAKSVGKTWAINDFGAGFFTYTINVDMENESYRSYLFSDNISKAQIMRALEMFKGEEIIPSETLIIFENIESVSNYKDIMRYIFNEMSEYYICYTSNKKAKVLLDEKEMGVVTPIRMYPINFGEFLIVCGEAPLVKMVENYREKPIDDENRQRLEEYLKIFYIVGGMPKSVKTYVDTKNFDEVYVVKNEILKEYKSSFSKNKQNALRKKVNQVIDSIGEQLVKDNKKFQYGVVKLTARAREYEDAVKYVFENGLAMKLNKVSNPLSPLSMYKEKNSFEMFMVDIGLLTALMKFKYEDFDTEALPFMAKNGALTEQFVFQELLYNKNIEKMYYWTSEATAKIEFVFEDEGTVIPIEININCNQKAQSLKIYKTRYDTPMAIRITREKLEVEKGILNIPLYSVWNL